MEGKSRPEDLVCPALTRILLLTHTMNKNGSSTFCLFRGNLNLLVLTNDSESSQGGVSLVYYFPIAAVTNYHTLSG